MKYMIWDKEVGVVKAAKQCKSIERFKELREEAKRSASRELAVYTKGKTLTFICE